MQFTINRFRELFRDKIFSLTIPWFSVKSWHFPNSCQIPWHFQVFQTSGHPAYRPTAYVYESRTESACTAILHSDGRSGRQRLYELRHSPCSGMVAFTLFSSKIYRLVWPASPAPRPEVLWQHCSNQHQEPADASESWNRVIGLLTEQKIYRKSQTALFSFKMRHTMYTAYMQKTTLFCKCVYAS